jgi:hypothetical protein
MNWTAENIEKKFKEVCPDKEQYSLMCRYFRLALTGKLNGGPPLHQAMEILGLDECARRMIALLETLEEK